MPIGGSSLCRPRSTSSIRTRARIAGRISVYGSNGWPGWQRCPVCGLASLPPESSSHHWVPVRKRVDATARPGRYAMPSDPDDDNPIKIPIALTTQVIGRAHHTSPTRLIFKTGLLASSRLTFRRFPGPQNDAIHGLWLFGGRFSSVGFGWTWKPPGQRLMLTAKND